MFATDRDDLAAIERLVALDPLPEDWRAYFEKKLADNTTPSVGSTSTQRERTTRGAS